MFQTLLRVLRLLLLFLNQLKFLINEYITCVVEKEKELEASMVNKIIATKILIPEHQFSFSQGYGNVEQGK